jgi:flavin reductase (DIM6/NTAB) family NADH-FMN oxidoreductase RutF
MIVFEPSEHTAARRQGMMSQLIVPRPIAMISTCDPDGVVNVAPYSYFMPVTGAPMLLAVTMGARREHDGAPKHTYTNAKRTGDFVVNVTTDAIADQIELAAMEWPTGVSELEALGWSTVPSQKVTSPSLAESPAHLECVIRHEVDLGQAGEHYSAVHLVVAEVVCVTLDESVCDGDYRVDQAKLAPIGRMGFPFFNRTIDASLFELGRTPYHVYAAGLDAGADG